jgi:raffinose/stachyose/melibiose transport system substrate-binding protein
MRKKVMARLVSVMLTVVLMTTMLTGCRFGFASDPDDPNAED